MTCLLGGILSATSSYLRPLQKKQMELDAKRKIITAVRDVSSLKTKEEVLAFYADHFVSKVVNYEGEEVLQDEAGNPLVAENINIAKQHKLPAVSRLYPVFMFVEEGAVSAYVFPMFGSGLWDWIASYIAFSADLNTIRGVSFDHKSETPGLGARITSPRVQDRYKGKKILDVAGNFLSVTMLKGEQGKPLGPHEVDGMSGATMTGKGVNAMLRDYFKGYGAYIDRVTQMPKNWGRRTSG